MSENNAILKIENVSKQYQLGKIGGGTLQGDLQSWWAKVRGKEDPNTRIGSKQHSKNDKFWALEDISLEIKKGEAIGIIGHNGAGKSTLLKLLSRVTAPTKGQIYFNGRIASMLEVGTGFHPELTGRENIYMNGAILGMSKSEIDNKVEQIIDFSECRQFIDTPVKRYSSGMYVKLAFSVSAHLDSEILVMDEVLAVGDMQFQKKCINKMLSVSEEEGRTILYVSHNMNTIRQLCDRCIVLDHGKIIFEGDVEKAISIYMGNKDDLSLKRIYTRREDLPENFKCKIHQVEHLNTIDGIYKTDEKLQFSLSLFADKHIDDLQLRFIIQNTEGTPVGTSFSNEFSCEKGENTFIFELDMSGIAPSEYTSRMVLSLNDAMGYVERLDMAENTLDFRIDPEEGYCSNIIWLTKSWGYHKYDNLTCKKTNNII